MTHPEPHYTIGQIEITRVTEQVAEIPATRLFPEHADEIATAELPELLPLSIHSWIVRTPRSLVVIDTATGNHKDRDGNPFFHQLDTRYPARLAAAGVDPADVDLFLLTHLHTDHIGRNTRLEGDGWVPMFPNAIYVFSRAEHALWVDSPEHRTLYGDSVRPVVEAGLARLIDTRDRPVVDEIFQYLPSPGHSPDHCSIALVSNAQHALFGGDVMHHPIQIQFPHWNSVFCENKPRAAGSRRWALDWCVSQRAIYFSSHCAGRSAGSIVGSTTGADGYDWSFV